jgi:formylglycine-generating enzyme required for sulfatase activity
MSCHTAGIIYKEDEVRAAVEANLAFPKADVQLIQDLYPRHDRFKQLVEKDNELFRRAVQQTGAQVGRTDPVAALAQRYEWEVDIKLAAAEVGLGPDAFTKAIARSRLALTFGPLASRGGTVKRSVLAESFPELIRELQLGEMFPRTSAVAAPPKKGVETPRPMVAAADIENSIGMRLRRLPPGKFHMGSPATESDRDADEKQQLVVIARSFAIGVFEVTQGEYEAVMKKNPSFHQGARVKNDKAIDTRRLPVEQVTWEDAVEFCKQLSALPAERAQGRVYRLPTEEEWEYACRGGVEEYRPFHFGASLSSAQANFDGSKPYGAAPPGDALGRPRTVGFYEPNGFGLYDMHGNVAEWVAEPFKPKIRHVLRGGSWQDHAGRCRSAARHHTLANLGNKAWGFRIVLDLDSKP